MENHNRAKEIFISCLGNSYYMELDGLLSEYKSYNIPKEIELIWLEEKREEIFKNLHTAENSKINMIISNYLEISDTLAKRDVFFAINYLENNNSRLDTFTNVLICEKIIDNLKRNKNNKKVFREIKGRTLVILNQLLKRSITIDIGYKQSKLFENLLKENQIYQRIFDDINQLTSL